MTQYPNHDEQDTIWMPRQPYYKPVSHQKTQSTWNSPIHPQWHPLTKPKSHFTIYPSRQIFQKCLHNLQSGLILIGKLCDDKWVFTFDKQRFVVSKQRKKIIEGYWDSMNELWHLPLNDTAQNNQQPNTMEQSPSKHWFQHIKPMELQHPRAYHPSYQQ